MGQCAASPAYTGTGDVKIHGVSISGNVIPPVLFCIDKNCGALVPVDFMAGEHKSPEMLKINPFGQMPSMVDDDFNLAESTAILRYLAKTYCPEAYGKTIREQAECDWAMDWTGSSFLSSYKDIWYPVAGFGSKPADQNASNKAAVEKLGTFAQKFLPSGKKLIGGSALSIADYKFGTLVWYLSHPAILKATGYKNPPRIEQYVNDWKAALTPNAQAFLQQGWGFMDSKNQ